MAAMPSRLLLVLVPLSLLAACGGPELVVIERLAPGGGARGDGGAAVFARPQLDVLVRIESDALGFNPGDIMRVVVNGTDRTDEVVMGGNYALLRIDPAPVGTDQFVELSERRGPVRDTFTYMPAAFTGPTVTGVVPEAGQPGTEVTITGTGFLAGPVRVWIGGVEATTITGTTDTTIDALVPPGAFPGPVYVQVGGDAAEGLVGFQVQDGAGQPVPFPLAADNEPLLFAVYPSRATTETALRVVGFHFRGVDRDEEDDDEAETFDSILPRVNERFSARIFGIETIDLAGVRVDSAFAVLIPQTPAGEGMFRLRNETRETDTIELPFTVEGDE